LRQAYDYWQDQPDNYITGETLVGNPTSAITPSSQASGRLAACTRC